MSKYFDGYAKFRYKDMTQQQLIFEIKDKIKYIIQLKNKHKEEIAKFQSSKDYQIHNLQHQLDQQKEMWNELKEWLKNQITDLRHIEIKTKTQSLRVNDAVNCFRQVLGQMQELEGEDE